MSGALTFLQNIWANGASGKATLIGCGLLFALALGGVIYGVAKRKK